MESFMIAKVQVVVVDSTQTKKGSMFIIELSDSGGHFVL